MGDSTLSPNFAFLAKLDRRLALLATHAERTFHLDPVACLMRLRQLCEALSNEAGAYVGLQFGEREDLLARLRRLSDARVLPRDVADLFHAIRKVGNDAVHDGKGDAGTALHALKVSREMAVWHYRTFSDASFKPGPFVPPLPPEDASVVLRAQLTALKSRLAATEAASEATRLEAEEARRAALTASERAKEDRSENEALEALLDEAAQREAEMVERLTSLQAKAAAAPAVQVEKLVAQAEAAASKVELDEAETRVLIDLQLRDAGWEVDTETQTFGKGARPIKNRNLAIAEWPTEKGPADYVLFVGLTAVAVVEAKRSARDVSAAIEQSKRYSRAFKFEGDAEAAEGGAWGQYRIPFLFSTNGRPYLKQLESRSGIWFLDARRADNHARPLDGWYTPDGLKQLLRVDEDAAHKALDDESTDYLGLYDYQVRAIKATEAGLAEGKREMLLAMATGTGKTRTCIGLCYRLIKSKRFRRILFLVDRTALGIQATNAFKDARLENMRTFAEAYDLKELADAAPDTDTRLQIATIQALVQRIVYPSEGNPPPPVDWYDCIVVDECHRGYLLDREMGDRELAFRSEADYISKYRRVLEHFDAVKIGLTATPALHTTKIFGAPIFEYSYREAVIDGYLIDHELPTRIVTALAEDGIHWRAGEQVARYHPAIGVQLSQLEDDVDVEIDQFNKGVVTENFNRVVCEKLTEYLDPTLDGKTLIFCVNDAHADIVVRQLKQGFHDRYGSVDDDAVLKITGAADKPLELIRRYKNERLPNVAVTVDLLTTGIDVRSICNLVFLRRVRSRILYEQMLGRATRRCEEIGKEIFRIFDAVNVYEALEPYTAMRPVVVNPKIGFAALVDELGKVQDEEQQAQVIDEIVAKLQRKRRKLSKDALEKFETAAGMSPADLLRFLREENAAVAQRWFVDHAVLGEVLDKAKSVGADPILISDHDDEVRHVIEGFGEHSPPGDYLEGFKDYVKAHLNEIPALLLVTQRPRELTRKQLKELKLLLDQAGYSETQLRTAWRAQTNQDIAASIIGHIRQAALGDPLRPYEERVKAAINTLLASRPWKPPQRKWLGRIGKQLGHEGVIDRDALDSGQFQAEGGFERLNKTFDGELEKLLGDLNAAIWEGHG